MWTRSELKGKAKRSFKANYWKTVLVALILLFVTGGNVAARASDDWDKRHQDDGAYAVVYDDGLTVDELSYLLEDRELAEMLVERYGGEDGIVDKDDLPDAAKDLPESVGEVAERLQSSDSTIVTVGFNAPQPESPLIGGAILALVGAIGTLLFVVSMAVEAFLFNPLNVGVRRFFTHNLNREADVREVIWAFDHNYLETVKTMFLRDIYTVLWSLLLLVPGIVKLYEYRMIPYLLAEDPTMTKDRAFAESKRLMDGQKWKTFVLDLSFVGWGLLSLLTLGAVGVFYAAPYKDMTDAALYEALRYGGGTPALGAAASPEVSAMDVPVPPFATSDDPEA